MNMYAQTKVLPCQKGKFEKQDCGVMWLYWNSLKSTAGTRRVNYVLLIIAGIVKGHMKWLKMYHSKMQTNGLFSGKR